MIKKTCLITVIFIRVYNLFSLTVFDKLIQGVYSLPIFVFILPLQS